jgi:hypothetical protein
MLAHRKQLLESNDGCIAIDGDRHGKLITALRTAVENGDGAFDKDSTSHNNLFDAFRFTRLYGRKDIDIPSIIEKKFQTS